MNAAFQKGLSVSVYLYASPISRIGVCNRHFILKSLDLSNADGSAILGCKSGYQAYTSHLFDSRLHIGAATSYLTISSNSYCMMVISNKMIQNALY